MTAGWLGRRGLALGLLIALAALATLGGCAGVMRLDHDVRSFPDWADTAVPAAGDAYRLERLPSQRGAAPDGPQPQIEAAAEAALSRLGLRRVDSQASDSSAPVRWVVQLEARSTHLPRSPWAASDPWPGFGLPGRDYIVTGQGQVIALPGPWLSPPYYERAVALLLREATSGRVVYETRAAHDGPWPDSPELWRALFDAALDGFPQPPAGLRRVVLEIPR